MKLVVLIFSVISLSAFGNKYETFVGRVSLLKGKAIRVNQVDRNEVPLRKGDKVYKGDTIETEDRSIIKLKLVDESLITLSPNSKFIVDKFDFKTKSDRSAVFKLLKGKVRSNIPIKSKPRSIRYESETAALAVRGTRFLMNVHEDKEKAEVTEFAVLEGNVEVLNKVKKEFIEAKKGDHIIVLKESNGNSESHARKLRNEQLAKFNSFSDIQSMSTEQFMIAFETGMLDRHQEKTKVIKGKFKPASESEDWQKTLHELNKRLKQNRNTGDS